MSSGWRVINDANNFGLEFRGIWDIDPFVNIEDSIYELVIPELYPKAYFNKIE